MAAPPPHDPVMDFFNLKKLFPIIELQSSCYIVARMQKAERLRSASECQVVARQEATRVRAGSRASLLEGGEGGEQALAGVDQVHDYRFLGTVVTMRTREAYGFIRSDQVDTDVFFGLNHCDPELRKEAKNLLNKAVVFSVQHHQGKKSLEARRVESLQGDWQGRRLQGRVMDWVGQEGCLLQVTSGSGLATISNRLWSPSPHCFSLQQGRLGTPVTFLLAVAANFRLEARQLQVVAGKKEHTRVRAKSVMSCSSESEDMVAVKQVTSEEFSGELITKIGAMDLAALKTLFDRQLRQRLVALVQQPVGSRVVIAVILRSVMLEGCRVQDNISRMVMTNFLECCSTKQGCAVVQTCLEKFSPDNKLLVAEQLLELDSVEQFTDLWLYGGQVFSLCLDLLDSASLAAVAFSLVGHYSSLASSVRHYRPLRSLLTRIAATDCFPEILPELEQELVSLACSRFGHTVVASLLEAVPPALCHRLVAAFQGRVAELSCNPVCSAVMVVAVGVAAAGQQAELIEEVCTVTSSQADMAVIGLASDRHGHRVVLAMLQVSQHRQVHNLLKASILCKQDELGGSEWAAKVLKTIKTEFHNRA